MNITTSVHNLRSLDTAELRQVEAALEDMIDKKIVGIVVGSYDAEAHKKSLEDGEQVAKLINDFGQFEACLIEVGKGPWMLHCDESKATFDKEKFSTIIRRRRVKPEIVLILTKGKVGETGELQEYFDKMGVPFSGSGVEETR